MSVPSSFFPFVRQQRMPEQLVEEERARTQLRREIAGSIGSLFPQARTVRKAHWLWTIVPTMGLMRGKLSTSTRQWSGSCQMLTVGGRKAVQVVPLEVQKKMTTATLQS
eukprot:5107346-Amphidinium_carterae.1